MAHAEHQSTGGGRKAGGRGDAGVVPDKPTLSVFSFFSGPLVLCVRNCLFPVFLAHFRQVVTRVMVGLSAWLMSLMLSLSTSAPLLAE